MAQPNGDKHYSLSAVHDAAHDDSPLRSDPYSRRSRGASPSDCPYYVRTTT